MNFPVLCETAYTWKSLYVCDQDWFMSLWTIHHDYKSFVLLCNEMLKIKLDCSIL